jgi:hypothetical protein
LVGEEFSHFLEVDLNNVVLLKELSNAVDDILENRLEGTFLDLGLL